MRRITTVLKDYRTSLASSVVNAAKKALRIQSPSGGNQPIPKNLLSTHSENMEGTTDYDRYTQWLEQIKETEE